MNSKKVLPLFKSADPPLSDKVCFDHTVLDENPEILDIFKDQREKWDTSWIAKSTIDLEVRVWLMGCRAKLGARITHLHCREHSLTPLTVPSSLPYLTTLDSMEVTAYGLSETLVQVIEHNPNLRRIELNLYEHYSQKFSDEEMTLSREVVDCSEYQCQQSDDANPDGFQDETKAFTYDLSKLASIHKI